MQGISLSRHVLADTVDHVLESATLYQTVDLISDSLC